jgi:hypothetical protein
MHAGMFRYAKRAIVHAKYAKPFTNYTQMVGGLEANALCLSYFLE